MDLNYMKQHFELTNPIAVFGLLLLGLAPPLTELAALVGLLPTAALAGLPCTILLAALPGLGCLLRALPGRAGAGVGLLLICSLAAITLAGDDFGLESRLFRVGEIRGGT